MKATVFTALDPPTAPPSTRPDGEAIKRVRQQWTSLLGAYAECRAVQLVFVFITPGYKGVTSGESPWTELRKEHTMRAILEDIIAEDRDRFSKIQVVGVRELVPTFAGLESRAARFETSLRRVLLGRGSQLYYDSPKMVEAIIRIARGRHPSHATSELIFRLDSDVEPNSAAFERLIDFHAEFPDWVKNGYFFFSGNYRMQDDQHGDDLLNNFAVRCGQFAKEGWKKLLHVGGQDEEYRNAETWLNSLERVGANVHEQVISGAGLCMSRSAIRALPPFANMSELIVWIDDHVKRLLHENIRDAGQNDPHLVTSPGRGSLHQCNRASFRQNRHPDGIDVGDIAWHRRSYLPRLVRGCLMSGLIKGRRQGTVTSDYARAVETVMRWGYIPTLPLMTDLAEKQLEKILEAWQADRYRSTPLGEFAHEDLPKQGRKLIEQVLGDMGSYLELLQAWPDFVDMIEGIPEDQENQWLFR